MPILITRTKVVPPRRRSEILTRQRLIDMLFDLMDYKLVIVAAPAGYGKTSLLIDFAHQSDLATCWFSLDSLDQDPARFIAHLIAAIANRFPGFGKQSLATLEANLQSSLDLDNLVATIVNEAYEHIREHFIFIIDDYHLVNEQKEISYFISRLAQEVDENCHLILASRGLLTLPDMPLMVARSMVGGLSFEELAFQTDEIQALIMQNYHLAIPKSNAEELSQATEGWITGLLLSTETMKSGLHDRLRVARVSRVRLYDYLAQQILDQTPPDVRDFLLLTSIFEEFDIALCKAVYGEARDWQSLFEYIRQNNLFILPVGDEGEWIRYHHLFRDFLQARLVEENPAVMNHVYHRLIEIYSGQGEWEKAHVICQRLNDVKITAALIDRAGPTLVRNGRLTLLADWIDALPAGELEKNPHLMSLRAIPDTVSGQIERGLALLNQAVILLQRSDDTPGLARALSRRATVFRFMGRYRESLEDATEAQRLIGDDPALQSYQADALRAAGASLYQIGQVEEASKNWNEALRIYQMLGERQNVATILMELGLSLTASGQYQQALFHYDQALAYWREVNNTVRQANVLNNLGVLYHLIGNYERAAVTFEEALTRARQNRYTRMEAYILASIGDLYADLDANKAALDAYYKSRELARGIDYHYLLLYTDLAIAARFRASSNPDQAQRYLDSAGKRVSDKSSAYELGLYELGMGRFMQAKGDLDSAIDWLEHAWQHLLTTGQPVDTARAGIQLANAYYQIGELLMGVEKLKQAMKLVASLESHHILVVSGLDALELLETAKNPPLLIDAAGDLFGKVTAFEASIPSLRKRLRPQAASIPFAPPNFIIQGFGKMQVLRDGKPISMPEWQNQRKVRELFYYLLSHPAGISREQIGLTFWPESSASQLKLQFKNAIYRLRHALGPDVILFDEELYWFNRDLDYKYDVEDFNTLIALARSSEQPSLKINNYIAALRTYKGAFLLDAEGTWIWNERERLRELYIQAALELSGLYFDGGDLAAALEYCQYALDEEPCFEEAHRLAMRVYAARGNRAGINRQFERCKMILKDQVNAAPSPQTVMLYEALIQ